LKKVKPVSDSITRQKFSEKLGQKRFGIIICSVMVILHAVFFSSLHELMGHMAESLQFVPVLLAAFYFGPLVAIPLAVLLYSQTEFIHVGNGEWTFLEVARTLPGLMVVILASILVSLQRKQNIRRRETTEKLLRENQKRREAERRLETQRKLAFELLAVKGLNEGIALCLEAALEIPGFDAGGIYLLDSASGELVLEVWKNLGDSFLQDAKKISADDPRVALILKGKPVYLEHLEVPGSDLVNYNPERIRMIAAFPIRHENRVIACINLASHACDEADAQMRTRFEEVGAQVGIAVARLFTEEKLGKSEQLYQDLVETAQDLIWKCDAEGRYTYLNPAWEDVFGYRMDEMLGKKFTDFQNAEQAEKDLILFQALLAGKTVRGYETVHLDKSGNEINLVFHAKPVTDSHGNIVGTRGTAYDLTQRKIAEKELTEGIAFEELLSGISALFLAGNDENPGDLISIALARVVEFFHADRGSLFIHSPDAMEFLVVGSSSREGIPAREEKITEKMFPWMYRQMVQGNIIILDEAHKAPPDAVKEIEFVKKAGIYATVIFPFQFKGESGFINLTAFKPVKEWPVNIIPRLTIIGEQFINIIRRHQAVSERDRIFSNSIDMLATVGFDGFFKELNPAWQKTLGYTPEELRARPFIEFVHSDDRQSTKECISDLAKGESVYGFENRYLCSNGEYRWLAWNSVPIPAENIIFAVARDITRQKQAERVLVEEEERMRLIIENAMFGAHMYEVASDNNLVFIGFNPAAEKILGIQQRDFIGKTIEEAFPPLAATELPGKYRDVALGAGHFEMEQVSYDDNKQISGVYSIHAFNTGLRRMTVFFRDVTERHKAELEILAREALLNESQRVAQLGHYTLDIVSGTWEGSPALYELFGIDQDFRRDVNGWILVVHPDHRVEMQEYLANHVIRDLHTFDREYRIIRIDDHTERWVHGLGQLAIDNNGKAMRMFGTIQDITERKIAEESLAAEKERLSVTLRSIGDAVISTDTSGRIVLMNSVAEHLTGWKLEEAQGRNLSEVFRIVDETSREPRPNPADEVMRTGEIVSLANHTLLISKDGGERIIVDSGAPIRDMHSRTVGVVLVFRDNTEKQKTEENLIRTQKLESIGLLAGGIAHDFNNLLGGIFGYLEIARDYLGSGMYHQVDPLLERALAVYGRARNLTQQLLTFSKGGTPVKNTGNIGKVVKETVAFALSGSNVRCLYDIPEDLWNCDFDENQLSQAFDNIVINAKHAMGKGGVLEVSVKNMSLVKGTHPLLKPGDYVCIRIRDEGVGIPHENLTKIFDPFFTTKKTGSGLGLATSYSIIKKHDGLIEAESEVGKGTLITVWLPASKKETVETTRKLKMTGMLCGRVLVMDDEDYIREIVITMLERIGCSVETAKDGPEALAKFKIARDEGKPFKIAILDLTIPGGKGGKEIVKALLQMDPDAKIIASSGYSEDPVMSSPKKYGFAGKILKPYRFGELNEIIQSVLSS